MKPDDIDRWKSRVLDEVFAAVAADAGIGQCSSSRERES